MDDETKAAERPRGNSIVLGRYPGEGLWIGDWYLFVGRIRQRVVRISVAGPERGREFRHGFQEYVEGDGFYLEPGVRVDLDRVRGKSCRVRVTGPVKVSRDEIIERKAEAAARAVAL